MQFESMWAIPEPLLQCEVRLDDDSTTTVRRHGNADGLRLIRSHGNGLAVGVGNLYWSFLSIEGDLFVNELWNYGLNGIGAWEKHDSPVLVCDKGLILEAIDRNC